MARELARAPGFEIPENDGFGVLPPWSVPWAKPVVHAARVLRRATDTAPLWSHSGGRNLLRVGLDPHLDDEPSWLGVALDPAILATVSRYLGSVPLLRKMQLWVSPYAECDALGNRLEHRYHCDWADTRQVRMLVFVDDVTPDHGPLTMISARRSEGVRRASSYTYDDVFCAVSDDSIHAYVEPRHEHALTGPAGTIAFADTSRCFHHGSRVRRPGLERRMVMIQYLTVAGFKVPGEFAARSPYRQFAHAGHSALQRMVLGV